MEDRKKKKTRQEAGVFKSLTQGTAQHQSRQEERNDTHKNSVIRNRKGDSVLNKNIEPLERFRP